MELMFNNCRTFNEDDSPVGVAGIFFSNILLSKNVICFFSRDHPPQVLPETLAPTEIQLQQAPKKNETLNFRL